jgi:hypothetical protein
MLRPQTEEPKILANGNDPPAAAGSPGQPPNSEDATLVAIARDEAEIAKAASDVGGRNGGVKREGAFFSFVSSGFFFMLVGCAFLFVAAQTMGPTHAMMSFVLVVVGVAILLFGTGTQSVGEFDSKRDEANYKVKMAGGAGALAFCIAAGIVYYHPKMKSAFQIEKKYFVVKVQPLPHLTFDKYLAQFSIEGVPVPSMQRGQFMLVYVPYLESEEKTKRTVEYRFHYINKDKPPKEQLDYVELAFGIDIDNDFLERRDASLDFPVYCKFEKDKKDEKSCSLIEVDMQSIRSAQDQANQAGNAQRPPTAQENVPAREAPRTSEY